MAKRIWIAGILLGLSVNANAADYVDYYVGGTGSDDNSGRDKEHPWLTIEKANQTLKAGDRVFILAGTYSGPSASISPVNSGTSDDKRIVYSNYEGGQVTITSTDDDSKDGISLVDKSYVTITGITLSHVAAFAFISNGHYNIISNCTFDQHTDGGSEAGTGIQIIQGSTHNRISDCVMTQWTFDYDDHHVGSLLHLGEEDASDDNSSYNLVENNVIAYGGHDVLSVYSKYNVIRNNYFHNEDWDGHQGFRCAITAGPIAGSGHCLYEGNRFGFCRNQSIGLRSQHNIIRSNLFYATQLEGALQITGETSIDDENDQEHFHGSYNHIYSNAFFHNGYDGTDESIQGGIFFNLWGDHQGPFENVIKNNIFYDNHNGSIVYNADVPPQTIVDNWDENDVDPGFEDARLPSSTEDTSLPDLRLKSTSPCRNNGGFLTIITDNDGSGTTFHVEDAGYFMDGWGIDGVQGDTIQLEGQGSDQRACIKKVHDSKTIEVYTPLTWTKGLGVALAYEETKPDQGAYEYCPSGNCVGLVTPPSPGEIHAPVRASGCTHGSGSPESIVLLAVCALAFARRRSRPMTIRSR